MYMCTAQSKSREGTCVVLYASICMCVRKGTAKMSMLLINIFFRAADAMVDSVSYTINAIVRPGNRIQSVLHLSFVCLLSVA